MRLTASIIIALAILFVLGSCNGRNSGKKTDKQSDKQTSVMKLRSDSSSVDDLPGRKVYEKYCLTCHQVDASGVPGMYPPLNHADKVMGPPEELIKVVLFGLKGPIEVKGESYTQEMPAVDYLSDSDIADLLNYIKKTWGNGEPVITTEDVRKIRAAGKN